jgi:glycosyltransferase involved in cell wall biosynthesis
LIATTVPVTLNAFLLPFAEHFRAQGWRVDGMANGIAASPESVQAFDKVWDTPWSRNPLLPRNLFTVPAMLRQIVQSEDYDLVHVHTPVAAFVTRMALRKLRQAGRPRMIYTAHGFHFYESGPRLQGAIFRKLEQIAGRWTDYLVVINREDEQAARRYGIVPAERVRYMPGIGVDTTRFSASAVNPADVERVRQELGLKDGQRMVLMLAEFIARKRHVDAINALAMLNRPDLCIAFAGNGPLQESMQRLATRLGVADRVRFLGFRRDVPTLIQASAAMLLPSEQEGLPRSVMEAMAQGVPVIGTRIRGMTDLIGEGHGLLVPVGDPRAIADALRRIVDQPEEAKAIGERGRQAIPAYDLRNIIAMHDALYDEALGVARTPTRKMEPELSLVS